MDEKTLNKYTKKELITKILNNDFKNGKYDEDIISQMMKMKMVRSVKLRRDEFKLVLVYKAIEQYEELINEDTDVIIDTFIRCREFLEKVKIGYKVNEDEIAEGFLDLYVNAYLFSGGLIH